MNVICTSVLRGPRPGKITKNSQLSALKKLCIHKMDHTFLNASNTPSSFSNDLQAAQKLYFTHDRKQIFTDESDSDENESSSSEEEPDNSIESLGPEIEWTV